MLDNKRTILIADDHQICRDLTQFYLERTLSGNYDYEHIESGDALEKRFNNGIDGVVLAIIDNRMPPGRTGSEIIKNFAGKVKFPFILNFVPSAVGGDLGEQVLKDGAVAYFTKTDYELVALKAKELLEN